MIVVYPIMINAQIKDASMTNLIGDTEQAAMFREQMFRNKKYVQTLQELLPKWNSMGLLDPLH